MIGWRLTNGSSIEPIGDDRCCRCSPCCLKYSSKRSWSLSSSSSSEGDGMSRRSIPVVLLWVLCAAACGDVGVVTGSYATIAEATAEGAVGKGWVPQGLPPGTREIREAHDTD